MSRAAFALSLVVFGCGPRGNSSRDDCPAVADHLVELAVQDNGGEPEGGTAELQAELQRRCRDDRWSSARRDCLVRAADQDATLDCPLE